jgi:D-2-hydroxyacid dehydrogenase (NADP+)
MTNQPKTPNKLHIFLVAEEVAFHFSSGHHLRLAQQLPNWEIIVLTSEAELMQALPKIEWLDTWRFEADWYASAPALKQIFTPAAGNDWVKPDPSGRVEISHGAFHGTMIAEAMLGLMLHFNRQISAMLTLQQHHQWDRNRQQDSPLLSKQTVLIIGYGSIGKTCARYLTQLGTRVYAHRRSQSEGQDPDTGAQYIPTTALNAHLALADHVVLLLPGGAETQGFMNRSRLKAIKTGAYLYNFGRGTTLLTEDLLWALAHTCIKGAGIDVTEVEPLPAESPLWDYPNVVVLPHSACIFRDYMDLHIKALVADLDALRHLSGS